LYTSAWGGSSVYVAQSGNDQNNGATPPTAVKSVARGLALAAAGTEVQIAAGLYDEQLPPIPQGVALSGGWDLSFDPAKRTLLTAESLRTLNSVYAECEGKGATCPQATCEGAGLTCLTNSNGDRVATLRSPGGQALRQLVVLGPDLSSKNDGSSSFGVIVDSASGVRLDYVSIEAGNGAAGVAGASSPPADYNSCTDWPSGGLGGGGGPACGFGINCIVPSCGGFAGNAGASIAPVGVVLAQGGAGGSAGNSACGPPPQVTGTGTLAAGQPGGNGQNGIEGPGGAAAPTDPGHFTYAPSGDLVWVGNQGGGGGAGSPGAGGGGGAAGESRNVYYFFCPSNHYVLAGAGGNGNSGGCAGAGGGGGSSGGGTFALVVADTTVGSAGLALFGGVGGQGGGGGGGGAGALGWQGGSGSTGQNTNNYCNAGDIVAGTGGAGGNGGQGGGGGGGGGGNGGPSIQLVSLAQGALTMDATATLRYAGGRAGTGGSGGTGGQYQNAAAPGNGGSSAHDMSIPLIYLSASASSYSPGAPPADAVDGNPNTAWNSGGPPWAWIELDLKRTVTLAKVHLLVEQTPEGPTTHQLYFGPSPAPTVLIATLSQSTKDMQWLDVDVSDQNPTGRYLRVLTTVSPSWVAWREIVVQTQ
jgi:hypothetical protein